MEGIHFVLLGTGFVGAAYGCISLFKLKKQIAQEQRQQAYENARITTSGPTRRDNHYHENPLLNRDRALTNVAEMVRRSNGKTQIFYALTGFEQTMNLPPDANVDYFMPQDVYAHLIWGAEKIIRSDNNRYFAAVPAAWFCAIFYKFFQDYLQTGKILFCR
ncbi:hypothetical protein KC726_04425, partial [Candidatus Woesebacteria bacterium]|nr:hypothetical protein [Candidatus Woesebacteria bacterium]